MKLVILVLTIVFVACALGAPQYEFYDETLRIAYDAGVLEKGAAILHGPERSNRQPIEIENIDVNQQVPIQQILGPAANAIPEDVVEKLQAHVDSVPSKF